MGIARVELLAADRQGDLLVVEHARDDGRYVRLAPSIGHLLVLALEVSHIGRLLRICLSVEEQHDFVHGALVRQVSVRVGLV